MFTEHSKVTSPLITLSKCYLHCKKWFSYLDIYSRKQDKNTKNLQVKWLKILRLIFWKKKIKIMLVFAESKQKYLLMGQEK